MNGAAIPAPGMAAPAIPTNANTGQRNLSEVNFKRISCVAEELAMYAQSTDASLHDYFANLCISLSRGIDFAIANNEVPAQMLNLPIIFKLVCQRKNESTVVAAIMTLMVTVKHACNAGWFSSEETQELLALADEVSRIFNTPEGISFEQTDIIPTVTQIMSRYYPRLKLGHILASFDIKPGFDACAVDFHISKSMNCSRLERIRLLVTMKDNIDTSTCITNPQKVNILLNGQGVSGRMVGFMDLGPQLPTMVNHMLRYGTNLVQAVGQFDAHYIVLIAFMSVISPSCLPVPQVYIEPDSSAVDSDAEVIEGPSRISLNCPISFSRIKVPVKGKLCKHLQCFDLSNYIEMNSKRPSWRCPHCNQSVCYPDIRVDLKMSKILQEVAEGVVNVMIHSDGSWEATSGSNDHKDVSNAKASQGLQEGPEQHAASGLSNEPCNVYDLTEGDDNIIILDDYLTEDRKPIVQPDQITSTYMNHCGPSVERETSEINQTSGTQVQCISCSGPSVTFCGPRDYSMRTNADLFGGITAGMFGPFTPSPVLTDSVTPAATRGQQAFLGASQQSSPLTSAQPLSTLISVQPQATPLTLVEPPATPLSSVQPPAANMLQLQQAQLAQMLSNGFGGYTIPRNVSRNPTAIQALPVQQTPRPNHMTSSRPIMSNLSGNTSHTSLHPSAVSISSGRTHGDSVQQQLTSQSQLLQHPIAQMRAATPVQVPSIAFRATSGPQPAHPPQPTNQTLPQMVSMPPHLRARTQVPSGGSPNSINQTATTGQHYQHMAVATAAAAAEQAGSRTRQPPTTPIQIFESRPWSPVSITQRPVDGVRDVLADRRPISGSGGMVQTVSRTQDLIDTHSEQNWRPTGRMRGSLSGRAYSDALNQFIIRPTQTAPAPPGQSSNMNTMSPQPQVPAVAPPVQSSNVNAISPHLQVLLANRNLHASQPNPSQNNHAG